MGIIWVNVRFKLVDPEHKKPDRRKSIIISAAMDMEVIEQTFKSIESLVNTKGYVVEEMVVISG